MNSTAVYVSCRPDSVPDGNGSCILPCASWSWLPSIEEELYVVLSYFESVVLLAAGIVTTLVWIQLHSVLYCFLNIQCNRMK